MSINRYFILISFFAWNIEAIELKQYCIQNDKSTPCFTSCKRHKGCGNTYEKFIALTNADRQMVLEIHNKIRNDVAKGMYFDNQLPGMRGGLNALSYDRELEFLAGCWILQCNHTRESMRRTIANESYNQNIYQIVRAEPMLWPPDFIQRAVEFWFAQHEKLRGHDAPEFLIFEYKPVVGTAEMTNLIWGDLKYVGCAKMHSRKPNTAHPTIYDHVYRLYCNYGPFKATKKPYVYSLRSCEMTSLKYTHLCGKIRPINQDDYLAPINFEKGNNGNFQLVNNLLLFSVIVLNV